MRRTLIVFGIFAALGFGSMQASAQTWHQGRKNVFIVTTDAGDGTAREAISRLEQERVIIGQILHKSNVTMPGTINVIAVRDAESLKRAVPEFPTDLLQRGAISFDGMERSSIVFLAPQQWEAATRAVALTMLSTNYPHTPNWFNQGFARYVGSMHLYKDQVQLGLAPADDKRGEGWIRIGDVMSADADGNVQWQHESWLLVHWLISNSRLDAAGKYFYLTMNQQVPVRQAILQAFGEDAETLDRDLQQYEGEALKHVQSQPMASVELTSQLAVNKVSAADGQVAIANVMLDDHDRSESAPSAMKVLSGIMHNMPDNPAVQRSLAYGYLMQHDAANAVEHARRAIALQDTEALMHYILAVGQNGGDMSAIRASMADVRLANELGNAIKMNPEFAPAFELRGLALVSADKQESGIKDLGHAAAMRPRNDEYLLHLGQAQASNGDWDNARILFAMVKNSPDNAVAQAAADELKTGKRLKHEQKHWSEQGVSSATYTDLTDPRWKATPEMEAKMNAEDKEKVAVGPDTRPVKHLDGELVGVDCSPDPGAILTVSSRGNAWKLKVGDRKTVLLLGADKFSCTWKQKKVSVNYKASGGVTGEVVSLEVE
jgi:tetratricopeptide (TPR) repeat protein